ncbi:hypothetical protein H8K52_06420 [Undibacterium seohonense]|uniref:Lipoprotein n=1 Tax=Undibacterium seohonense TaxID=1344950 RepID=A0ABR6X251_9BURK|nr:hypothetical protein [Undibacterium seohonense]MBC3806979.1 hypothetical protein [Undibacterium seohonense]
MNANMNQTAVFISLRYFVVFAALCLSGCASILGNTGRENKAVDKFSAADVFKKPVETTDVIALLTDGKVSGQKLENEEFAFAFEQALKNARIKDENGRNHIQDRLILASNSLCEEYKTVLKRKQSNMNFILGSAATIFGAGGAIANGAQAAKNFAALAGLTTGIRAEYNQEYYADVMAHVITKAISKRRKVIFDEIQEAKTASIKSYNIEMALADVATYHGACSLIAGLETADDLVSKHNVTLGLDTLGATMAKPAQNNKPEEK